MDLLIIAAVASGVTILSGGVLMVLAFILFGNY